MLFFSVLRPYKVGDDLLGVPIYDLTPDPEKDQTGNDVDHIKVPFLQVTYLLFIDGIYKLFFL